MTIGTYDCCVAGSKNPLDLKFLYPAGHRGRGWSRMGASFLHPTSNSCSGPVGLSVVARIGAAVLDPPPKDSGPHSNALQETPSPGELTLEEGEATKDQHGPRPGERHQDQSDRHDERPGGPYSESAQTLRRAG